MQPIKRVISADLQQRIRDMKRTPLQARVTLTPGHDYWWFQEFGTAGRGSDAKAYGLGPEDFVRPKSVKATGRGDSLYEIRAKKKKLFFFWKLYNDWVFVPGGVPAPKTSAGKQRKNWYPFPNPFVMHPGVRPQAMLRRTLWAFRNDVRLALIAMAKRKQVPERTEIAAMLNRRLVQLKVMLEQAMPRYEQPPAPDGFTPSDTNRHDKHPGGPLAEAWDVVYFDDKATGKTFSVKG